MVAGHMRKYSSAILLVASLIAAAPAQDYGWAMRGVSGTGACYVSTRSYQIHNST